MTKSFSLFYLPNQMGNCGCLNAPRTRYGAFLAAVPPERRIGDYAHAAARVVTCILKRLETHAKDRDRSFRADILAVRTTLLADAEHLPLCDRVAPLPGINGYLGEMPIA